MINLQQVEVKKPVSNVPALLKARKMNFKEFYLRCQIVGITSRNTAKRLAAGDTKTTLATVAQLAAALDTHSIDELFTLQ